MRVYLLPLKNNQYRLFIISPPLADVPADSGEERTGSRKGLLKRTMGTLSKREKALDRGLKDLRKFTVITVYYPSHLSEIEAKEIYQHLIQAEIKKHKRKFIVNGLLLPLSVVFTLFPGPNVVLAYLAWRTISHYRSKKGAEKGLQHPEIVFIADPLLEELYHLLQKKWVLRRGEKIHHLGKKLGISQIEKLY